MDLSHRKAFELLQRSLDGRLDAGERAELERHLATCAQCQTDATLYRRLQQAAHAYRPAVMPSQDEIQRTIRETQAHHRRRRMFKRLSSPMRAGALVGAAAAFVLAVVWIFNTLPRQPQTGTSVGKATEVIKVEKETVVETVIVTATPQVFDIEAEREAVIAASEAVNDAFSTADLEALGRLYLEDASGFVTYEHLQERLKRQDILIPFEPFSPTWDDYDVIIATDLAVIKGEMTWKTPGNPPLRLYATEVFKKVDGQWKVIHTHSSYMQ
jgi:ketosteroid isomerase-like protein